MKRTFRRSLPDFGDLLPAERKLLEDCVAGNATEIGAQLPSAKTIDNSIRAEFVVFLAMGGDDASHVHHLGINLTGAWLIGQLDLQLASIAGNLHFRLCFFDAEILMQSCKVAGNLTFRECRLPDLTLDGAKIDGFVGLDRSNVTGRIRLVNAALSGMLSLKEAKLYGRDEVAMLADRLTIAGTLFLDDGFISDGGVRFLGAKINGNVSLRGAAVSAVNTEAVIFERAKIGGHLFLDKGFASKGLINLVFAVINGNLNCSKANFVADGAESLIADHAEITGNVFFRGVQSLGQIRMLSSKIWGNIECDNSRIDGGGAESLYLDGTTVNGTVSLTENFYAKGCVRLPGLSVGQDLVCNGARLEVGDGCALYLDGIRVAGNVMLAKSFSATGEVRLVGARIDGSFDCSESTFLPTSNGSSIAAEGATILGTLFLLNLVVPLKSADLANMTVGSVADDEKTWGEDLLLDGFKYTSFVGRVPVNTIQRIGWLEKQDPLHTSGADFKPQPWLQLQKVLREMGHFEGARQVAIALEDRRRKIGLIGQTPEDWFRLRRWLHRKAAEGLHFIFGGLIGYGYRPLRLLLWMMLVWLASAVIYWMAALHGVMGPSNPLLFNEPKLNALCRDNWYLCAALPEEYTGFSPLAYSLDVLLPLVSLDQEKDWAPLIPTPESSWWKEWLTNWTFKHFTRLVVWFEVLFGWISSLLLVAVFSGLTKRREE